MFGIISEVLNKFNVKESTNLSYKIINLAGKQVFVEGYKAIQKFSESSIILTIKNGTITIHGEKLSITELQENTVYVAGKIEQVEVN